MSIQAAKEELLSLTDFQREIHVLNNLSEDMVSNFYRTFAKSTWYSSIPMKLQCSADDEELVYTVNNSFHFLIYSYMRFVLPPIKVKPEYKGKVRIAWCHNVGTNIVQQAVFKEDDDTYQTWDNVWADIYFQFYQDGGAGKRDNHNIGIGNVACLENWTEVLPSYPINVDQPWFYGMEQAMAFPIYHKNSQTRASHRYRFMRKIPDLLRVQIATKQADKIKWKDVTKKVHKYLDINPNAMLKVPELWGRYAYISDKEIAFYRCNKNRSYYIRDVEVCDTANPSRYGDNAQIDLQCTNPCLAFFWLAQNKDAVSVHNYSNYTTDTNDLYSGWDPIKTTTLKYGTTIRLNNMPSDHFNIAESRKHFPSAPSERGYHGYSFASDSTNYHGDIGMVFANMNAQLICKIANNNIYANVTQLEEEEEEDDDDDELLDIEESAPKDTKVTDNGVDEARPNFITRARLLVIRKFTIYTDDDNRHKFMIR